MKANMWQFLQTYVNSNWKKRHRNTSGNFKDAKTVRLNSGKMCLKQYIYI